MSQVIFTAMKVKVNTNMSTKKKTEELKEEWVFNIAVKVKHPLLITAGEAILEILEMEMAYNSLGRKRIHILNLKKEERRS